MTQQTARTNILKQITTYLSFDLKRYQIFNEQFTTRAYSVTLLSADSKHCILAKCSDVNDVNAMVTIVQF